ncbi:hypothetical protein HY990_00710 [Candidatus Micrarchaeota archaeon]|nr:hypothetical protein [Candidatus Micrarchaeota archaeon]
MEYHEKVMLLILGLVVVFGAYFLFFVPVQKGPQIKDALDRTELTSIVMKGLDFGTNLNRYEYVIAEKTDGFVTQYNMTKNGGDSSIEIKNALSQKKVYLFQNDTILCVDFEGKHACSSVKDNADLTNYIGSLQYRFFDAASASRNKEDYQFLIDKKYLTFQTQENTSIDGKACRLITYTIEFSNASINDAARFGIGASSPKRFDWRICVDEKGMFVLREFEYKFPADGKTHSYEAKTISLKIANDITITKPTSTGDQNAVDLLRDEKQSQADLVGCYQLKPSDKDTCLNTMAIQNANKDICALAGTKAQRCLVSLVPITKDPTICQIVQDAGYRDDCLIEVAGALKNQTYCSGIQNQSKTANCQKAALTQPQETVRTEPNRLIVTNATTNQTDINATVQMILEYVESRDANQSGGNNNGTATPQ